MQTELLKVSGMTGAHCAGRVTQALKAVSGVGNVDVSLSSGEVTVYYDERLASPDLLEQVVKDAGYGVNRIGVAPSHHSKGGCCG